MFALKAEHCMSPGANDTWFLSPNLVQDKEKCADFRQEGKLTSLKQLRVAQRRGINAIISRDSRVLTSIKCASYYLKQ